MAVKKPQVPGEKKELESLTVFNQDDLRNEQDVFLNQPFKSEHAGFLLVSSGSIQLQCNLDSVICKNGSLYFILPQQTYIIEALSDDCCYVGVRMSPDFMIEHGPHLAGSELYSMFNTASKRHCLVNSGEMKVLGAMMSVLQKKTTPTSVQHFTKEIILHQLMAVLYEAAAVFRRCYGIDDIKITRKEDITNRFIDLLRIEVKNERSLKFYAAGLFVSTGYLTKVIKETLGKRAGELIDAAVIIEIKKLLGNPALSISQIAEELNFNDPSIFGKYFKTMTGLSPLQYRNGVKITKNNLF